MTKKQLIQQILTKWLDNAPEHIINSATKELARAFKSELQIIVEIDPKIFGYIACDVLHNLVDYRRIAQSIYKSEQNEEYEVAEHLTSEIGLKK